MGSYSRLAGGVFTDIVIISHSHVLGKSPKEQTSPCHLVGGFHFDNVVADNCIIDTTFNALRILVLGMTIGYLFKKLDFDYQQTVPFKSSHSG